MITDMHSKASQSTVWPSLYNILLLKLLVSSVLVNCYVLLKLLVC